MNFLEFGISSMIPDVHSSMVRYSLPGYSPGGSLRAWRDNFPNSQITGIDIQPDTQFSENRITTHLSSSTNRIALDRVLGAVMFDIILDDGSHIPDNQLTTLLILWGRVKAGGYYIIEDMHENSSLLTADRYKMLEIIGKGCTLFFSENKKYWHNIKENCIG